MAGSVHVPWYATGFRSDDLAAELERISAISLRYGASSHVVYRSRDDRYKFLQVIDFESKLDWERYWYGPEMIDFRSNCQSWFQVPIVYVWHDIVTAATGPGPALPAPPAPHAVGAASAPVAARQA
jgi:hypothetical protein